jgi:hypothetical protein
MSLIIDCLYYYQHRKSYRILPIILWRRIWPSSYNWRITQLSAGENNSSDHPAWSGKPTSPHNFN